MSEIYKTLAEGYEKLAAAYRTLAEGDPATEATPDKQEARAPVPISIEEVRAVLASKTQAGKRKEVKSLLLKYDSGKLSAVKPEDYAALLADAEAL
ncbi:MAG: hypothetical protein LUI10_10950 [Lachnospiraceae bacterium]|nr:hypothetical protein [Lachnospiraceae bacterium]